MQVMIMKPKKKKSLITRAIFLVTGSELSVNNGSIRR
jgi:hypothetical protein